MEPKLNVPLLRQVQAMIRKYPQNLDMNEWSDGLIVADKHTAPDCGTTACIAGWALALRDGSFSQSLLGLVSVADQAMEILGCDSNLFYIHMWEASFRDAYCEAYKEKDSAKMASVTCDYIDYYIEKHTGQKPEPEMELVEASNGS